MYLTPENCTLEMVKVFNFMLCIFYHNSLNYGRSINVISESDKIKHEGKTRKMSLVIRLPIAQVRGVEKQALTCTAQENVSCLEDTLTTSVKSVNVHLRAFDPVIPLPEISDRNPHTRIFTTPLLVTAKHRVQPKCLVWRAGYMKDGRPSNGIW